MTLDRRTLLSGLALLAFTVPARAQESDGGTLLATDLGLVPDSADDQSDLMQYALQTAAGQRAALELPGGRYRVEGLRLPDGCTLKGTARTTVLEAAGDGPVASASGRSAITLSALTVDGAGRGSADGRSGLVNLAGCEGVRISNLRVGRGAGNGIMLTRSSGVVENAEIYGCTATGVFALDCHDLRIAGNRVHSCGNGGIRVWRSQRGHDGTIVTANHISGIASRAGGNGQNGNGINIFRSGAVIVSDNVIADCDFSAIRANSTDDTLIRGNACTDIREVAIFSEFGFSGSIIADNVVDGAAAGISMTNFDQKGHLATCTGNIVRNILAASPTNPDTTPYGISAQADATVSANVVESVPGVGINAGWGPYLRDVSVTGNVVRDTEIGIAVSVAPKAGAALVANNLVSGARRAGIAAMAWRDMKSGDLPHDAARFPNVTLSGNRIG